MLSLLSLSYSVFHATVLLNKFYGASQCVQGLRASYSGGLLEISLRDPGWLKDIGGVSLGIVGFTFCVLRFFFVIEAFISLRSLPDGAYATVSWVSFLPHIG